MQYQQGNKVVVIAAESVSPYKVGDTGTVIYDEGGSTVKVSLPQKPSGHGIFRYRIKLARRLNP